MGIPVIIYGKSGSGKSRSLKDFGEEEIFLVNVAKKPLPFPNTFKYEYKCDDCEKIMDGLRRMPVKTAVIDDAGYLQTNAFMRGHSMPKKGASTFDLYNDIADNFWKLLRQVVDLPDDVIVFVTMHETTTDYGETKLRTIGKLLDEKVCIEGMATIVLRCCVNGTRHFFRTQSDGMDISKSPEGMFELEIENNLKFVEKTIRDFYKI